MAQDVKAYHTDGIALNRVSKRFDDFLALDEVSFSVRKGEFMSLLGPSGCGKTTALRIIAGFEKPTHGSVHVGGADITHLHSFKRNVGLVFQNYALWPHMTVHENIAFGLKLRKLRTREIEDRIQDVLALTNLSGLEARFPRQLSGGQQQRVALARVLVLNPAVLLMDEPLSNLDRKMRVGMRVELKQLQQKLGMTTLYVTHDQEEALSMSDRLALMNRGRIVRVGSPREIYERPQSEFEADFVGNINRMNGVIAEIAGPWALLRTEDGLTVKFPGNNGLKASRSITLVVRPERVRISSDRMEGENVFAGTVVFADFFGSTIKYFVETETGFQIVAESQNLHKSMASGDRVYVNLDPHYCHPIETGALP